MLIFHVAASANRACSLLNFVKRHCAFSCISLMQCSTRHAVVPSQTKPLREQVRTVSCMVIGVFQNSKYCDVARFAEDARIKLPVPSFEVFRAVVFARSAGNPI